MSTHSSAAEPSIRGLLPLRLGHVPHAPHPSDASNQQAAEALARAAADLEAAAQKLSDLQVVGVVRE